MAHLHEVSAFAAAADQDSAIDANNTNTNTNTTANTHANTTPHYQSYSLSPGYPTSGANSYSRGNYSQDHMPNYTNTNTNTPANTVTNTVTNTFTNTFNNTPGNTLTMETNSASKPWTPIAQRQKRRLLPLEPAFHPYPRTPTKYRSLDYRATMQSMYKPSAAYIAPSLLRPVHEMSNETLETIPEQPSKVSQFQGQFHGQLQGQWELPVIFQVPELEDEESPAVSVSPEPTWKHDLSSNMFTEHYYPTLIPLAERDKEKEPRLIYRPLNTLPYGLDYKIKKESDAINDVNINNINVNGNVFDLDLGVVEEHVSQEKSQEKFQDACRGAGRDSLKPPIESAKDDALQQPHDLHDDGAFFSAEMRIIQAVLSQLSQTNADGSISPSDFGLDASMNMSSFNMSVEDDYAAQSEQSYEVVQAYGLPFESVSNREHEVVLPPRETYIIDGKSYLGVEPSDTLYDPVFIRRTPKDGENYGWCDICGKWMQLRNHTYAHHFKSIHGISQRTKTLVELPKYIKGEAGNDKKMQGYCEKCGKWVDLHHRRDGRRWQTWYIHQYQYHHKDEPAHDSVRPPMPMLHPEQTSRWFNGCLKW